MSHKGKYCSSKPSANELLTGSSDYSTCSDNAENFNVNLLQMSKQSEVIAGHMLSRSQEISENSVVERCAPNSMNNETVVNETNYSIGLLDQTIDPEDSIFMNCRSISDYSVSDSTKYIQLGSPKVKLSGYFFNNNQSINLTGNNVDTNYSKSSDSFSAETNSDPNHLTTIVEEKEVTSTTLTLVKSKSSNKSPLQPENTTGSMIAEIVSNINNNRTSTKRVLFTNKDDDKGVKIIQDEATQQKVMKMKEACGNQFDCYSKARKNADKTCNIHNTTESFVMWEKYCQASDTLISRRSFSFSELNSSSANYGDDEQTSTFVSLDDTYVSHCSVSTTINNSMLKRKSRHQSKSCESLLKEVKHLPHVLYDRFLRSLAKEIENIRKENVVCTCLQSTNKKKSNKQTEKKTAIKSTMNINLRQTSSGKQKNTETKSVVKASPLEPITNQVSRLSPNCLMKDTTKNTQINSPKSPKSTTPLKKRGFSSWHKEIVSPVGEYIKGKRPSPFKPVSKKL